MVSVFQRVRTISGNEYLYEEYRWREGKKMRSKSICLGRVGGTTPPRVKKEKKKRGGLLATIGANLRSEPGAKVWSDWERDVEAVEQQKREAWEAFKAKEAAHAKQQLEEDDAKLTDKAVERQEERAAKESAPN